MDLVVMEHLNLIDTLVTYGFIGMAFFTISIFVMVFLFGWAEKPSKDNVHKLTAFLIISLSVPTTVGLLQTRTSFFSQAAYTDIQVTDLEVTAFDTDKALVNLTTSEPAVVYLEYRDASRTERVPILPPYTLESRTEHSFIIDNVSKQGGEADLVLDGTRYLVEGDPIEITR